MNNDLTKIILEKYPTLFNAPGSKYSLAHIECNDGWFDLIDELCGTIAWDIENNRCPPVQVTQIKEKFGTLRFYYQGGNERIDGAVSFAEALSARTCDVCGNKGKLRGGNWLRTLCDQHTGDRPDFEYPTVEQIKTEAYRDKIKKAEEQNIPCTCGYENIAANAPISGGQHDDSCAMMK